MLIFSFHSYFVVNFVFLRSFLSMEVFLLFLAFHFVICDHCSVIDCMAGFSTLLIFIGPLILTNVGIKCENVAV